MNSCLKTNVTSWYLASLIWSLLKLFSMMTGPLAKPKSYIRRRNPFFNSNTKKLVFHHKFNNSVHLY